MMGNPFLHTLRFHQTYSCYGKSPRHGVMEVSSYLGSTLCVYQSYTRWVSTCFHPLYSSNTSWIMDLSLDQILGCFRPITWYSFQTLLNPGLNQQNICWTPPKTTHWRKKNVVSSKCSWKQLNDANKIIDSPFTFRCLGGDVQQSMTPIHFRLLVERGSVLFCGAVLVAKTLQWSSTLQSQDACLFIQIPRLSDQCSS